MSERKGIKMIWYPYEQMKTMKTPYKIINAEGVYLCTEDQKLIDSVERHSWLQSPGAQ